MSQPDWMMSGRVPAPELAIRCPRCHRAMRRVRWEPALGRPLVLGLTVVEDNPDGSSPYPPYAGKRGSARAGSAVARPSAARWWDASEGQDGSRYRYECGARRAHRGVVTARRLTELYLHAAERGAGGFTL